MRTALSIPSCVVALALAACSGSSGATADPNGTAPDASADGPIGDGGPSHDGGARDGPSHDGSAAEDGATAGNATRCDVPGLAEQSWTGARVHRVRLAPDGTLYLFAGGVVRRFTKVAGDCAFARDMAFGSGGELDAWGFDLAPDGHVVTVLGGALKVHDVSGAALFSCQVGAASSSVPIAVSPDGKSAYVLDSFAPDKSRKVTLTSNSCSAVAWSPAGAVAAWTGVFGAPKTAFVTADAVYAGAGRAVYAYGTDGSARPSIDRIGSPASADGISDATDVVVRAAQIDVVDFNGKRVQRFSTAGAFVASFDAAKLGLPQSQATAMTDANGMRWLVTVGANSAPGHALYRVPSF
jgi:hypothetical protein